MTTSTPTRFVALDVHRNYLVVGAVDAGQKVVLSPRRFGFDAFDAWAPAHLTRLRSRRVGSNGQCLASLRPIEALRCRCSRCSSAIR